MRASRASRPGESRSVPGAARPATLAQRHERDRVTGSSAGLEHEPREPCRGRTLVPGDVLREAFVELPEERIASRGASAVHDLCRRLEQNAPPGLAQTRGQIALFCVKEEALDE